MSIINEALKQLREDWNEQDILSQETLDALNKELQELRLQRDEYRKNFSKHQQEEGKDFIDKWRQINSRIAEINQILHKHELTKRYFNSSEELAEEEDWDELLERLPNEFEFEDLEVEVETEEDDEPTGYNYQTDSIIYTTYPAQHGYVNNWTCEIEPTKELVARFLNKKIEEITKRDLAALDEDDYYDFVINDSDCILEAEEDATENWEYDDVDWDEPPEPDYDDYYDDRDW